MSELYCIDRIENGVAVLQRPDGSSLELPACQLPAGAAEGDILRRERGGWLCDRAETARRRQRLQALLEQLT